MKHNSRKKKRGVRSEKRSNKKDMKTPFTISIIVLILFVVLIIFSIFNGPIKAPQDSKLEISEDNIIVRRSIDPTVNINLAIASNDVSKCNNDKFCENMYYSAKAESLEDCERMDEELVQNCKDNIYFEEALNDNDKSKCSNIVDDEIRNACMEEVK